MLREACCYERLSEGRVRCNLCIRRCIISEGKRGFCRVRGNRGGKLYNLHYGELSSFSVDYVEKTPLYLFYPNHQFLNLGGVGCNLACEFCLTWNITQVDPNEVKTSKLTPEQIARAAKATRCRGIVYTHSEPTLNLEFYLEVMKAAKEQGLKNVLATNGYVTMEAFSKLEPYLDAVALTFKGSADFYPRRCGVAYAKEHLHALARRIRDAGKHLEVVMVLIPGENDDEASLAEAVHLAKLGNASIIFLRFFPSYRMDTLEATDEATLERALSYAYSHGVVAFLENIFSHPGKNLYCSSCGKILIRREGYGVVEWNLRTEGEKNFCKACGALAKVVGDLRND
jgi:pyruvate formate lyase activating enzyme